MSEVTLQSTEALLLKEPDQIRLRGVYEISKTHRHAAISEYEELSKRGSLLAKLYLGYVYRGLGESDRALYWFEQAFKGGSVEAALQLGIIKTNEGRLNDAEYYFRRGAEAGDPICKYKMTDTIIKLGRKKTAALEIEEVLKSAIDGGSIRAKNRLAFLYMGGLFGVMRRFFGLYLYFLTLYEALREAIRDHESRRLW